MESELTLGQREQYLLELLGPQITLAAPADLPSDSKEEECEPELFTFHHVRDRLFAEASEKRARKEANRSNNKSSLYMPSTGEQDAEKAEQLAMVDYPEFKGRKPGDISEPSETFMLWDLVVKYPELYIGKTNRIKAAALFEYILEDLIWDFHYLYNPHKLSAAPALLVPTKQFERFLNIINAKVGIQLAIPPGQPGEKFFQTFSGAGICRPRYLGRTTTGEDFKDLENVVPLYDRKDSCEGASSVAIEDLVAMLDVSTLTKNGDKKKEKSAKKRQEARKKKQENIRLVQRWLGIQGADECLVDRRGNVLDFDLAKAVPYERFSDVVFAAIDVEVAERSPGLILEIGVSILDAREITAVAPGKNGNNWFPFIKSYHLHTDDYRFMRNKAFVKGCPESFSFGESEFPRCNQLADRIRQILDDHVKPDHSTAENTPCAGNKGKGHRPLIVVGHGIESDVKYLRSALSLDLSTLTGFDRFVDTKDMHQCWRDLPQGRKLSAVLEDLQVPYTYLHNAGNDAAYTLRAMLALAIHMRLDRLSDKAHFEALRDEQCLERTGTTEKMEQSRRMEYATAAAGGEGGDPEARRLAEEDRKTPRPGETQDEFAERYHAGKKNW